MLKKIISMLGVDKFLSPEMLKKGIEKVEPRMKRFFSESAKFGYPLGATLGFLKSEFTGQNQPIDPSLRPDEAANLEIKRQKEFPARAIGTIGNIAGGAALGGLGGAALSAASQFLPSDAQNQQPSAEEPQSQQPGGFLEFIKQNPELGSYLDSLIQKGMDPIQAASQAKKHRKFAPLVERVERQMGQSFEDLLAQLFQGSQGSSDQRSQGGMSNQSAQGSDQSGGDSELIAALQQILKM